MADVRERAERLLRGPVGLSDLALEFEETTASTADVHVGGANFFPPILADISSATSSVHVNQFGFKPGTIGEEFAGALLAKASEGIPVRLVVDSIGSRPDGASRELYERLLAGGVEVRVVRGTGWRASPQPAAAGAARRWNFDLLGHVDHRKCVLVDGRVGWVGGAGVEDHFADGRFHDLFLVVSGPVVLQLQLVFLATFRWLGGEIPLEHLDALVPAHDHTEGWAPATVLHNAPGSYRPITTAIADLLDRASEKLDVVNPYVADKRMIGRILAAAERGAQVRLFVPAKPNNVACAGAQRFHHKALLEAGVRIVEHPAMLHAKAFVRDGEDVLIGTCNLDSWSLKRFFELDVLVRSRDLAAQFEERFSAPAELISTPGRAASGPFQRISSAAFAAISPII